MSTTAKKCNAMLARLGLPQDARDNPATPGEVVVYGRACVTVQQAVTAARQYHADDQD